MTLALKRMSLTRTQVRIKENMATHLDQEFISLRNALVNERDRAESLEERLRLKSQEYERSAKALSKAKKAFEGLNAKFSTTIEDFDNLRKVNQAQRDKLEKYASISGVSSGQILMTSDIYSQDKSVDSAENITRLKNTR